MCAICRRTPCDPRCPNSPEQAPEFVCDRCGHRILSGEEFLHTPGGTVCKHCIDNMDRNELFEFLDVEYITA